MPEGKFMTKEDDANIAAVLAEKRITPEMRKSIAQYMTAVSKDGYGTKDIKDALQNEIEARTGGKAGHSYPRIGEAIAVVAGEGTKVQLGTIISGEDFQRKQDVELAVGNIDVARRSEKENQASWLWTDDGLSQQNARISLDAQNVIARAVTQSIDHAIDDAVKPKTVPVVASSQAQAKPVAHK